MFFLLPDHELCFQMSRFQSGGGGKKWVSPPPQKSMFRSFFWKSDKWTYIQVGGRQWVLMIFRTPREELLGQKITFMYFEKPKVTLEVYNVNKKYFWLCGGSYKPCKNSSAQKIDFVYFEKQKVTLGVYNVNKKHFWWCGSSYEPCKNSSWRTPRPKNLILCILSNRKWL